MTTPTTTSLARPLLPLPGAVMVAAAGGAVLDLAFPSVGAWPLAFVGIAMALVTLIGRSVGGTVLVGVVFGASFYLLHIVWATRYLGYVPWLALGSLQAALWGVGSILIVLAYRWMPRISERPMIRHGATAALVGGLWTARELFMGSWPYTGFPWGRMGMSQSESPLASIASWVGVSGLTFLMVTFTALVIETLRFSAAREDRAAPRRSLLPLGGSVAALLIVLLAVPMFPTSPNGTITVGSVQGNGPAGAFDDRRTSSVFDHQREATQPLMGKDLDVLLWPEGAVDWDPLATPEVARALDQLSDDVGAPILFNAITQRDGLNFNTSILWNQNGERASDFYDKRYPVPFGEYVPHREFYQLLVPDLIGMIQRDYTAGTNDPVFRVAGHDVGLAICFDVVYDDVIWEGADLGAEVYMFQTNNADFRGTDENLQQLAFARMRAIETGRSVVNLSTVGTSQVIGPDGRTRDELVEATPGAMLNEVELRTGLTPAVIMGAAVQGVLMTGSIAALTVVGVVLWRRGRVAPRGA